MYVNMQHLISSLHASRTVICKKNSVTFVILILSLNVFNIVVNCNMPTFLYADLVDWTLTCSYTDTMEPASVWTFFTAPQTGWDLREELSTGCR